ncbi:MAG: hypothetical protein ACR2H3_07255 [Acidimicrobiales bacterium]
MAEVTNTGKGRGPAAANAIVLLAIMLAVAVIALPASQTPPPAIAEFSPNAQEQITEAPPEQTSDFGEGEGGSATGNGSGTDPGPAGTVGGSTTTTTQPTIDRGKVRRCVGNPPRQTEDPHSPPCVNFWEGDNGGVTAKGVTANEVRIAVPSNGTFLTPFLKHFNSRYELYGRKIVATKVGGSNTPVGMVTKAIKVDKEVDAFASTLNGDAGGREYIYYNELARRGIVSVNGNPSMTDEANLARNHPYEWSYLPPFDVMARNKAEWICKSLRGKTAEFAGGSERARTRKFGLVVTVGDDGSRPNLAPMTAILGNCGIDVSDQTHEIVKKDPSDDQFGLQQAQDIILKLQTAQVTSIICECHTQSSGLYMAPIATKQGYFPEWLFGTYMYQAEDIHVQFWDGSQMDHSFGLGWWNKQVTAEQSPWFWALRDADPSFQWGSEPFDYYEARWLYNSLLVLVSGLQLAGPNLTADTFAVGLQRATFPNPNHGQTPYWQADVGFKGDHSFINDAALVWASKSQPSSWSNVPGAVCYARQGQRYSFGRWPSDYAGLFQLPCY